MLHPLREMIGATIRATDGDLGTVHDFYFDDTTWTIRYMVAETGSWLLGRKVLIGLVALGTPDWESGTFSVTITCEQVKNSPSIDTEMPVYRQHEIDLHAHYQWPNYWAGYRGTFGLTPYPLLENPLALQDTESLPPAEEDDLHLRSTLHINGYRLHATDGEIGHITDFIVDEENWSLAYIVVETGNWFIGDKVLIALKWVRKIEWSENSVYVNLSRDIVKQSPEFDPSKTILRPYKETV